MFFSESNYFLFRFEAQRNFYFVTLFFSPKTIFLRHKVLTEYFFLSMSET